MTDPDAAEWANAVAVLMLGGQYGSQGSTIDYRKLRREVLRYRGPAEQRAKAWLIRKERERVPAVQYTGENRGEVEDFVGFPLRDFQGGVELISGGERWALTPGDWVEADPDRPPDKRYRVTRRAPFDPADIYQELQP